MEIKDELPFWSAPFGVALLDTIRIRPGMRVLDIGSGSGFPMLEIAARLGHGSFVTGVEPSADCADTIRAKILSGGLGNAAVVEGVAEDLPFPDASFDLVTSNNGMNNVQGLERSFAECWRVCRPGGQFVFTQNLPHTFTEFYEVLEAGLREKNLQEDILRMHDHIFEKRKPIEFLQELSLRTGFTISSIQPDGFRYRFSDPAAFFGHPLIRDFFLPRWYELVPAGFREEIFEGINHRLALKASESGSLEMSVPFACFDLTR